MRNDEVAPDHPGTRPRPERTATTRSPTPRWGTVAGAAVTALVLTACGGGAEPPRATVPPATADPGGRTGTPEQAAASADRPEPGQQVQPAEFLDRLRAPGPERLGSFTLTMELAAEGQALALSGEADLRGDTPAMEVTVQVPDAGPMHLILLDGAAYLAVPGLTADGSFVRLGPEQLAMAGIGDLPAAVDLQGIWDAWETGTKAVTFVGVEEPEDEELERFTLELDAAALAGAQGGAPLQGVPSTLDYDVWLDEEDLIRRLEFDLDGASARMQIQGWGEPVEVSVPEDADVVDLSGLSP